MDAAPVDDVGAVTLTGAEFAMIRTGVGYTRAEIAQYLGDRHESGRLSVQTVGHWEKGKYAIPAKVGAELESLEGDWIDAVEALVAHMNDAVESVLMIPRGDGDGRPGGWWLAVAHQVTMRVPELTVEYRSE